MKKLTLILGLIIFFVGCKEKTIETIETIRQEEPKPIEFLCGGIVQAFDCNDDAMVKIATETFKKNVDGKWVYRLNITFIAICKCGQTMKFFNFDLYPDEPNSIFDLTCPKCGRKYLYSFHKILTTASDDFLFEARESDYRQNGLIK